MLAGALYAFCVVILPGLYTRAAQIPEVRDTNLTSGVASFVRRNKYGYLLKITTDDKQVHIFSCRDRATSSHECLDSRHNDKYKGHRTDVRWAWMHIGPLETHKHAIQIVIDGNVVLTRDESVRRLQIAKSGFWVMTALALLFIAGTGWFDLWIRRRREHINSPSH
jgi:hypothetical protein